MQDTNRTQILLCFTSSALLWNHTNRFVCTTNSLHAYFREEYSETHCLLAMHLKTKLSICKLYRRVNLNINVLAMLPLYRRTCIHDLVHSSLPPLLIMSMLHAGFSEDQSGTPCTPCLTYVYSIALSIPSHTVLHAVIRTEIACRYNAMHVKLEVAGIKCAIPNPFVINLACMSCTCCSWCLAC